MNLHKYLVGSTDARQTVAFTKKFVNTMFIGLKYFQLKRKKKLHDNIEIIPDIQPSKHTIIIRFQLK